MSGGRPLRARRPAMRRRHRPCRRGAADPALIPVAARDADAQRPTEHGQSRCGGRLPTRASQRKVAAAADSGAPTPTIGSSIAASSSPVAVRTAGAPDASSWISSRARFGRSDSSRSRGRGIEFRPTHSEVGQAERHSSRCAGRSPMSRSAKSPATGNGSRWRRRNAAVHSEVLVAWRSRAPSRASGPRSRASRRASAPARHTTHRAPPFRVVAPMPGRQRRQPRDVQPSAHKATDQLGRLGVAKDAGQHVPPQHLGDSQTEVLYRSCLDASRLHRLRQLDARTRFTRELMADPCSSYSRR